MCRFVLYLGQEVGVGSLVTEPRNSIIHQSHHAQERAEPLNGDGFGVAWYADGHSEPALFRDVSPAWNDVNLLHIARVTRTRCLLAHVRAASPGLPVHQLNCHPFAAGDLAFMHNGSLGGFRDLRRAILRRLSDDTFDGIEGSTDSEHVFALFLERWRLSSDRSVAGLADALRATISETEELRREAGVESPSLLNLAVTDGKRAVVSRYTSDPAHHNTLYFTRGRRFVCEDGVCRMEDGTGAIIVASEPLTDRKGWEPIPINHLITVDEDLTTDVSTLQV